VLLIETLYFHTHTERATESKVYICRTSPPTHTHTCEWCKKKKKAKPAFLVSMYLSPSFFIYYCPYVSARRRAQALVASLSLCFPYHLMSIAASSRKTLQSYSPQKKGVHMYVHVSIYKAVVVGLTLLCVMSPGSRDGCSISDAVSHC
jgi:hypothetical protein